MNDQGNGNEMAASPPLTAMGTSACQNVQQECFHLPMPSPHDLQHVLDMHIANQD